MKIKNLFATPKKAVITSVCMAAVLAVIGTGTALAVNAAAENNSIGTKAAEGYALADAGVSSEGTHVLRTEFEREQGQYVYEVEFLTDGVEYDYVIDAKTGAVLAKNTEGTPISPPELTQPAADQTPAQTGPEAPSDKITIDRAKEIALADAGVSADAVTYTKQSTDYDDGVEIYDVEFYTADTEYEYEIRVSDGVIADKSAEAFTLHTNQSTDHAQKTNPPPAPQQTEVPVSEPVQSTYIGVDSAKNIAVSHAGFSAASVTFIKAKLENDDGRAEYEVEFYMNGMEYDYSIDAVTGAVLEYDSEYDD